MKVKCACGRQINQYYHNSTIKRKQCPSCELKNLTSGDAKAVKSGLKKKEVKRKKKTSKKKLEDELDEAWSKLVKLKAGKKCEVCGKTKYLNSHHIYSRGKHSVRWNTENGICLCVGHHVGFKFSAHKTPTEFTYWLEDYKGKKFMEELKLLANQTANFHEFEMKIILDELQNEINSYICKQQ